MNIVVCIKQVPDTTEIKIDPVKNTLIRTGVPSIMNPFDKNALETGPSVKRQVWRQSNGYFHGTAAGKSCFERGTGYGC